MHFCEYSPCFLTLSSPYSNCLSLGHQSHHSDNVQLYYIKIKADHLSSLYFIGSKMIWLPEINKHFWDHLVHGSWSLTSEIFVIKDPCIQGPDCGSSKFEFLPRTMDWVAQNLDCMEIKPLKAKGNQSWIFLGRTSAEAEAPKPWPPDTKSQLIGEDPDAGKDWRWEQKGTTEDEMVGWHHWFSGHEFEQASGRRWRTGKLGILQSLRRVRHEWATEHQHFFQLANPVRIQLFSILIEIDHL